MFMDRMVLLDKCVVHSEEYQVFGKLVDRMLKERKRRLNQFVSHRENLDMPYFRGMAKDNVARGTEFALACAGLSVDQMARRIKSSIEYGAVSDRHDKKEFPNGRDVNRALKVLEREIYVLEYLQGLTVGCMDPFLGERIRPKRKEIEGIFEREVSLPYMYWLDEPDLAECSREIGIVMSFLGDVFGTCGIDVLPEVLGDVDLFWPEGTIDSFSWDDHFSEERLGRRKANMGMFCYTRN